MIFQIGTLASGDYSNRVLAGSYNVNNNPVYESWIDANGTEHRIKIRDRISGSFDMFFKDITEYNSFVSLITSLKLNDESVLCSVAVNNSSINQHIGYFFIDFSPTRNRKGDWSDFMEQFTVNITER